MAVTVADNCSVGRWLRRYAIAIGVVSSIYPYSDTMGNSFPALNRNAVNSRLISAPSAARGLALRLRLSGHRGRS